ncbi:methyltransferase FkbM family [Magnetococcus marinus MC-1]|uniref:Methyltransferase FkbM family n=1 Tax=Magnetococcus marinus (strain ATCC BAA-1437 / JCM 17883 / MC-1) TaxID=156889 RepID=A0LAD7_MAGMM|nr:FkbM family methyltransferase [Magnetococcus marinus]ABK44930.1 methyltransferase FkbM family [Magnetococcus marinus MC-1]
MAGWLEKSVNLIPWWMRDHIRKIPLLAWLQRRFFARFLAGRHFDYQINAGPAKGLWMPISLPTDKLIWTGTYEKVVGEKMGRLTPTQGVCLDIGSHRGYMAGIMALHGAAQVHCFEPMPDNITHLQRLQQLNPELPLYVQPYAMGNRQGDARFAIMPESSMGKLSDSSFQVEAAHVTEINVAVRRVDDLVAEGVVMIPQLIKVDVEGAELEVLAGAQQTIEQNRPIMVIEVHSSALAVECQAWLQERGYRVEVLETGAVYDPTQPYRLCHLLGLPVS